MLIICLSQPQPVFSNSAVPAGCSHIYGNKEKQQQLLMSMKYDIF